MGRNRARLDYKSEEYYATLIVVNQDPELAKLGDRILTAADGKID